jgi:hypothetical protein
MKSTQIIAGFPAVGKSLASNMKDIEIVDLDSSNFPRQLTVPEQYQFPNNYITAIKELIGKVDLILISSHQVVRFALKKANLPYTIVYPSIELKNEYIKRFKDRGNDYRFINYISENWSEFIMEIENEEFPTKIRLKSEVYLSDVLLEYYESLKHVVITQDYSDDSKTFTVSKRDKPLIIPMNIVFESKEEAVDFSLWAEAKGKSHVSADRMRELLSAYREMKASDTLLKSSYQL